MTRAQAMKLARAAIAKMGAQGEGYKPKVWCNFGWHASIVSPCERVTVFINGYAFGVSDFDAGTSYTASLCDNRWWSRGARATPCDAILSALVVAHAELTEIKKLTEGFSDMALTMAKGMSHAVDAHDSRPPSSNT